MSILILASPSDLNAILLKNTSVVTVKSSSYSTFLATILTVAVCVSPTFAQQEAGDTELQLSGSATTQSFELLDETIRTTTVNTNVKAGQYFTRELQLGVTASVNAVFQSNRDDAQYNGRGGAFANYSFLTEDATRVPYLGGQYSKNLNTSFEDDSGSAGVNGGVKFYLNRRTAFDVGANYLFPLEDTGNGLWLFQFGISYIL